ncbi:ATP-binding cassette domain-containing protein [Agromyces seonyuensis]|uniref:ATP-binding cassette domain-containing protein n=1 Tax=Agromyces seonyuensis TaxID=2662446 RepID=A0A6I4NT15_9MICO|nr:ATP-binding cassette domain-containing protein [Agromyces seonyuensis]MWB97363.1 ATP-binding cassette domain-containing protein [Agromyces seonyuensis]
MIVIEQLTKRFGSRTAVDSLTATVQPGRVTGFLGPNGAGKSTTMRMIVGLDRPTSGSVTVGGKRYDKLAAPMHEVGALLDAKAAHPGRSAESHLRSLAATHGIGKQRVDEVIAITGLESVARRKAGKFSLGMGQRLGIAVALLGDPATLILDEPVNGLDPEGVMWVRQLARHYAAEGRTVLLSSHLMSEMAQTADHVLVLGRGRLIADAPIGDLLGANAASVRVRSPRATELAALLAGPQVTTTPGTDGAFEVRGLTAAEIGDRAGAAGISLHELTPVSASLEEAYLALTQHEVEYRMEAAR